MLDEGVESRSDGVHRIHWKRIDSDGKVHFLFVSNLKNSTPVVWGEKPFQWNPLYPLDSNTFSIRNGRSKIVIMLNEVEKCETESTASVFRSGEVYKRSGKCGM